MELEPISLCSACGADVARGALRCSGCGVAFRGRAAVPQVTAEARAEGLSISLDVEEMLLDEQKEE